ncbi:hypothetical protein [Mycobacterium sp. NPDC050041]|uniref:hypothetical protein n=1 Tax=Mycobacterium sp. NPDC050041 TaxID=3364293 RepID=UPI003C2FD7CE
MSVPPQGPPPGWPPPQGPPQWGPPQGPPPGGPPPWGPAQGQPQWGASPPHWPPPQGQPWAPPTAPRPPSKNTGLIVGLVAAAVVVVVVVVLGLLVVRSGSDEVSDEQRLANATTATDASDFNVVCEDGSVSNAAAYRKPYTIAAFRQTTGLIGRDVIWTGVTLEGSYAADDAKWSEINAVACVSRVAGSEVKSGTCEFDDGEVADHYAVEYEITVHEAKSGRAVENLGTVNGPATDCPFMATVESDDPRIYGSPDPAAVDAELAEFAAG